MFRAVVVVVAAGSATWTIVQAIRGYFDLWAPLAVVISVLSLIGDAAERRRQRLLPGPSVNELAAALADILDRKCRAEVADRRLLEDPGLLPVAWAEVEARAPSIRIDETRPDQRIRKRFEDATFRLAELFRDDPAGRLVVLGQPGAGKSVLALTLQAGLLKSRFDRPADEPVPALVSVASWNPLGATLNDFLVDSLARAHYGGNPNHPRSLLEAGRVLPILDGLDEIPELSRGAAVTAVNEAIGRHGWPLVVTCRLAEYEDLIRGGAPPLRRSTVIRVLPVRPRDAVAYLKASSTDASAWAGVFAEIERPGSPIAEAYSTPLMVSIAKEVYGRPGRDPREQLDDSLDSQLAVENNLLDRLVDAAYPPPDGPQPRERPAGLWPKEKASRYLTALARYLYDAQERDLRWWDLADRLLPAGTGALLGTVVGLLMMVASLVCFAVAGGGAAGSGLSASALVGLLFLVLIMAGWSLESAPPGRLPARPFSPSAIREAFAVAPTLGVLMWIPFALGSAVAITAIDGWSVSSGELFLQSMGLASALLVAFAVALSAHRWLLAAPAAARLDSPRAVLRQDRTSALVSAAASGLVFALLLTPLGLIAAVLGSAVYGWTTGGAGWLQGARLSDIVRARLVDVVPGYFATWPVAVWLLVVVPGLLFGTYLLVSRAWFRFQIARVRLAGARVLPWRLLGLLEDAGRRELLRQSGGAYQFRHLRLQERLADDQSAAYRADLEAARRRRTRRRRILVPALIVAFLASLAVPLTAAPRDSADTVLRLPYGSIADNLVVSPDGETLATTSTDGVRLWRLDDVGEQDDHPYVIATAGDEVQNYFNPNGRLFFVRDSFPSATGPDADAEPRVRVWRWAALGWEQLGPARPPEAVVLLAGGAKVGLLSATDGRANATLTVHSAEGGPARPIPGRFADDLSETQPPEYDADGTPVDLVERRFVLSGKDDGSLAVWDTAADPPSAKVIAQPGGGPSEALVDPAGRHMVVRTESGAKLFDLSRGTSVPLPFRETKSDLRFDPTGTWLAGSSGTRENDATDDRMVTVWNAANGRQRGSWTLGGDVVGFEFVPGASALIVTTAEQDSGHLTLQVLPVGGGPASPPVTGTSGYTLYQTRPKPVLIVEPFRPDATRGRRDGVDILDAASGALLHSVAVTGELEQADAWSPRPGDDKAQPPPIVAITADGGRMAWNSVTGKELGTGGRVDWVDHLQSPLGTVIAGKSGDRLAIYDARTGELERRLIRSRPPPSDVDYDFGPIGALFNADGRFLAAPAGDDAIQVWDLAGPRRSIELNGHSGKLATFAWGRKKTRETLISAGAADSTVRLWRL